MTINQIAYWNLEENKRHNLASEELAQNQLIEAGRHNLADESIRQSQLNETQRANIVKEAQNAFALSISGYDAETRRQAHNENVRHNLVGESQQAHSLAQRDRQLDQADVSNAISWFSVQTNRRTQEEAVRANKVREQQTALQLSETERHNRAGEAVAKHQLTQTAQKLVNERTDVETRRKQYELQERKQNYYETEEFPYYNVITNRKIEDQEIENAINALKPFASLGSGNSSRGSLPTRPGTSNTGSGTSGRFTMGNDGGFTYYFD